MAIKPSTRELEHRQDAAPREPMPAWIPRPVKRQSGRTDPLVHQRTCAFSG